MPHHPIIQKVVDELFIKGSTEPSTGDPGFYSNVFAVPRCTGALQPILNLKQFNCYIHIPTFKMPIIRQVQQHLLQGDYTFSIDLKDAYLHFSIVKHHHPFLYFLNFLTSAWQSASLLDHTFTLETGCEDYSFLDQAVKDLSMVLILSSLTLSTHQNWRYSLMRLK